MNPNRRDPHDRVCTDCKQVFTPFSMDSSRRPAVTPPDYYQCLSCRSKVPAG